jgi:hypothetical protein
VGALFALAIYEGGANPVPLMAVAVLADSLPRLGRRRDRVALVRSLPLAGVVALMLAAPRLLAMHRVLGTGPAALPADGLTLDGLFDSWFAYSAPAAWDRPYGWDEYAAHIGWIPVALMLGGAAAAFVGSPGRHRDRRVDDLALFAILLWLAFGTTPKVSLYAGLHRLPVYSQLRVPSRFMFPAVVALAMLAGHGLLFLRSRQPAWFPRLEWFVLVAVVCDLAVADAWAVRGATVPNEYVASMATGPAADHFTQAPGNGTDDPANPTRGQGAIECYHPQYAMEISSALVSGDVEQQWVLPPEAGRVRAVAWTPNRIELDVQLVRPARLVVNQNDDPDWRASEGGRTSENGLLAVDLASGERRLMLSHRPYAFWPALLLATLGAVLAVWIGRTAVRGPRTSSDGKERSA